MDMPVREFNILRGPSARAVMGIFQAAGKDLPSQAMGLANLIASKASEFWQNKAEGASPWGIKYARAITWEPMTRLSESASVFVDDEMVDSRSGKPSILFVHMTESGVKPFSIKEGLLSSKRVKTSSKGVKYIVVPFRWRTPKKGQVPSDAFSGVQPGDVYKIVKSGIPLKGEEYGHMAGLQKIEKPRHSQYFTFRAVSEKSTGWQHPGKEATPVFEDVLDKVEKMIEGTIENYLQAYIKKLESTSK